MANEADNLRSELGRFSRRRRGLFNAALRYRLCGLAAAAGIVALPLLSGYLPNAFVNLGLFAALVVFLIVLGVKYLLRRQRFVSHLDEAFRLEELAGGLNSRVVSALDFARHPEPSGLMQLTIEQAKQDLRTDWPARLDRTGRNRSLTRFAILLVVLLGMGFSPWIGFARFADNFSASLFEVADVLFPAVYSLTPAPGKHVYPLGQEVNVELAFTRRGYRQVTVVDQVGPQTVKQTLAVDASGKAVLTLQGKSEQEHRVRFEFGRRRSGDVQIIFTDYPIVENMQTELVYPVYTRMLPKTLEGIQDRLFLLPGTKVSLGLTFSKELAAASLVWDDGEESPMDVVGRFASTSFLHSRTRHGTIRVEDVHGMKLKTPLEMDFQVQEDEKPQVFLPAGMKDETGVLVEGLKLFGFGVRLKDDFGVTRCVLKWTKSTVANPGQVLDKGEVERVINPAKPSETVAFEKVFEHFAAVPGDRISFYVEVYDNCYPKNQMASSPIKSLFVFQQDLEDLNIAKLGFGGGAFQRARIGKSKRAAGVSVPMGQATAEKFQNEFQAQIDTSAKPPPVAGEHAQAVRDYFKLMSSASADEAAEGGTKGSVKSPTATSEPASP